MQYVREDAQKQKHQSRDSPAGAGPDMTLAKLRFAADGLPDRYEVLFEAVYFSVHKDFIAADYLFLVLLLQLNNSNAFIT